ncbi:hypothetical protein P8452_46538 [Trifolium repens]|nr:hypothetical protein P8452_46538 [Trifolium repens]
MLFHGTRISGCNSFCLLRRCSDFFLLIRALFIFWDYIKVLFDNTFVHLSEWKSHQNGFKEGIFNISQVHCKEQLGEDLVLSKAILRSCIF